jgi:hypothetical protein
LKTPTDFLPGGRFLFSPPAVLFVVPMFCARAIGSSREGGEFSSPSRRALHGSLPRMRG